MRYPNQAGGACAVPAGGGVVILHRRAALPLNRGRRLCHVRVYMYMSYVCMYM